MTGLVINAQDASISVSGGGQRLSLNQNSSELVEVNNGIVIPDGSTTTPSIRFSDDLDTGIYSPTNGEISLVTDGAEKIKVSSTTGVSINSLSYPSTDGMAGQVMTTDGAGNITFQDAAAGGGGNNWLSANGGTDFTTAPTSGPVGNNNIVLGNNSSIVNGAISPSNIIIGTDLNIPLVNESSSGDMVVIGRNISRTWGTTQYHNNTVVIGKNAGPSNSTTTLQNTVLIGTDAISSGSSAVAIGSGSYANSGSVGLGWNAWGYGSDSVYIGHSTNTSAYRASGAQSVAIGKDVKATAPQSVAIGNMAASTGSYYPIAIGANASALDNYAICVGKQSTVSDVNGQTSSGARTDYAICLGTDNHSSGIESIVLGHHASTTTPGKMVFAAGMFTNRGDAQSGTTLCRVNTTDATTADIGAGVYLPADATFFFTAYVVARNTGNDAESKTWEIKGAIRKGATNADTVFIGTPTGDGATGAFGDTGTETWSVSATAHTTLGGLVITATGEAAKSINWVARIETVEVVG